MRYRRTIFVAALCTLSLFAAQARAADPVVSNDTSLSSLQALNGMVVYKKQTGYKKGVWMRLVNGKLRRATRIPNSVYSVDDLGLDKHGRTVLTFATVRRKHGVLVSTGWHIYDVARDRTRLLRGLPQGHETRKGKQVTFHGCLVGQVLLWRSRMAYDTSCSSVKRTGLWLKDGQKTRRINSLSADSIGDLSLRGGALAGVLMIGPISESATVVQLAIGGKPCFRRILSSQRDGESGWGPANVWIANGQIVWSMGGWEENPRPPLFYFSLLAAKLPSGCGDPGQNGRFDFTPEPPGVTSLALDGRRLVYAGKAGIHRHTLPAQPSFDPPANDNFENAQLLPGDAPTSAIGWTAYATKQPGDPMTSAKQTLWYAFRPTTSRTLYADLGYFFRGQYEIYTGSSLGTLTRVPSVRDGFSKRFDAVAGETYYIGVGTSDEEPLYDPFYLEVTPQALHG
jgi:hypothetical protein